MSPRTTSLPCQGPDFVLDLLRTRFGVASGYFHSLLCEAEDRLGSRLVFEVRDPLLEEVQQEIQDTSFHPHYAEEYRRVESSYWGPILEVLRQRRQQQGSGRACLDVGAGHGTLIVYAARLGWKPYAMDIASSFLSPQLIEKYHILFHVANVQAEKIPWSVPFDLILMTETLEHFNHNPLPTLEFVREHLADDGLLVVTTPDKYSGWGEAIFRGWYWELPSFNAGKEIADPMGTHVKVYGKAELENLLTAAGFSATVSRRRRKGWRRGHLIALSVKPPKGSPVAPHNVDQRPFKNRRSDAMKGVRR